MDRAATFAFAKRIRDISTSCFDLGAAQRIRLLADEMEKYEDACRAAKIDDATGSTGETE
jgi:hypothetical protein